jgi:putative ABC transport system permease protein
VWKVTRKGLLAHKVRFVLTGIAVILGVAFVSGTFVFTATIKSTFDDLITNIYKNTDAQVRGQQAFKNSQGFGGNTRPRIPATLEPVVAGAPGVQSVEGNVQLDYAQIEKANGKVVGKPGQGPPTLGFGWNGNQDLSPWRLVPGGHPPTNANEIVIDKGTASKGDFTVGQVATVLTNKPPKQYTITGIARFGSADNLAGASVTLFTVAEAQRIADAPNQFDYINVKAQPGVSQDQVAQNIRNALPPTSSVEVVTGHKLIQENQSDIQKALGFLNTFLLVFGIIALIVGGFIIYNTFNIIIAQRSKEMALLRAIGASRAQVLTSVLGESVAVGIVASAIGVLFGILLAIGLRAVFSALGASIPGSGVTIPPTAVIYGLFLGLVVTVFSSLFPALNGSRIPPVAAMRDVAIEKPLNPVRRSAVGFSILAAGLVVLFYGLFGARKFQITAIGMILVFLAVIIISPLYAQAGGRAIGKPIAKLRGITAELARENVGRNPRRTASTAAALMIGVALVAFISIAVASTKASFADQIDSQIKADYIVNSTLQNGGAGLSPSLGRSIAALPEIETSTPVRGNLFEVGTSVQPVIAIDPAGASLFNLDIVAGSLGNITPDGLIVSKKKADSEHWTIGSQVPVTFVKTGHQVMRVEAIYGVDFLAIGGGGNYLMSIPGFEQNFAGNQQLDFVIYAKLKPGVTAEQGKAAISPLVDKYPTAKLQDLATYKADQLAQLNGFVILIYILLVFAIFIAAIGVINTLLLSVYERTREVGLLRAVGMARSQVRSATRWESVLIAWLGTFMGIILGFFFGWVVVRALHDSGITKFSPAIRTLVAIVVLAFFLGVVAAILPGRRAAKLDVLTAISSE